MSGWKNCKNTEGRGGHRTVTSLSTVNRVEQVYITNQDGDDGFTYNASSTSGVEEYWVQNSADADNTTVNNIDNLNPKFVIDNSSDTTYNVRFTDLAVDDADDTVNIEAKNLTGTAPTVDLDNDSTDGNVIENVNLTSSGGSNNALDLQAGSGLDTLNIGGEQNLTLIDGVNAFGSVTTIDASSTANTSELSGDLDLTVNNSKDMSITGGTGDDVVEFAGGGLTSADTVDLGGGTNSIRLNATNAAALAGTDADGVSNVQQLIIKDSIDNTTNTVDTSNAAFADTFVVDITDNSTGSNNNTLTLNNIEDGETVRNVQGANADGTDGTDLTVSGDGGTTQTVNVDLQASLNAFTASNLETLDLTSGGDSANTVYNTFTAANTTQLNISGDQGLTIKDLNSIDSNAEINASGLGTNALDIDLSSDFDTYVGSDGTNTVNLATDSFKGMTSLDAGSATDDRLVAGQNDLTEATTPTVSGFETIEIQDTGTSSNTIDASQFSGLNELEFSNDTNSQTQTVNNLASGVNIGIGSENQKFDGSATLSVGQANDTTDDSLTFDVDTSQAVADADVGTSTTVETVNLQVDENAGATLDLADVDASTVNATGGSASQTLTLNGNPLNAATTKFNSADFDGNVLLDMTNATTGVNVTVDGGGNTADTVETASGTNDDTITVEETTNPITVAAGAGTGDVLNLGVANGFTNTSNISGVETINLNVASGDTIDFTGGGPNISGFEGAETLNLKGGGSGSVVKIGDIGNTNAISTGGGSATVTTIDANSLTGDVQLEFADDQLTSDVSVKGTGSDSDTLVANYAATTNLNGSNDLDISGIETVTFQVDTGLTSSGTPIDLTNVSGVDTFVLTQTSGTNGVNLKNLDDGQTVQLGNSSNNYDDATVDLDLADNTGDSNSLTIDATDTSSTSNAVILDTAGVEDLTFDIATGLDAGQKFDLSNVTDDDGTYNGVALTLNNGQSGQDFTMSALSEDIDTINAGSVASNVIMQDTASTDGTNITTGAGDDLIQMANGSDVLDAGADNADATTNPNNNGDTLALNKSGLLSTQTAILDLTQSDQVQTFAGTTNSTVQTGFSNVDASDYGAEASLTGDINANKLTGTDYKDVINGAEGDDVIVGGAGNDDISGGAGADTITGGLGGDTIDGGASQDSIKYTLGNSESQVTSLSSYDVVDPQDGNDKIVATGTTLIKGSFTAQTQTTTDITNSSDLLSALTEVSNAGTSALVDNEAYLITDITDSGDGQQAGDYLVIESGDNTSTVDSNDEVIQLLGNPTDFSINSGDAVIDTFA